MRVDQFLASRGLAESSEPPPKELPALAPGGGATLDEDGNAVAPTDFACEEDIREAVRGERKLLIGEKTILTPSARDLGESQNVFVNVV